MSRPVTDPEWEELLARFASSNVLRGNSETNAILVDEWRNEKIFHGCSIHPRLKLRAGESVWLCKFFLAGAQRTLGRGTLQQCALLYDTALVFFADYRTKSKRPEFNFGHTRAKQAAKITWVKQYFSSMMALLDRRNEFLRTGEQKLFDRRVRIAQRQHDTRTAAGRIEKRLSEIEAKLHSLDAQLAAINRVELLLATILHSSNITMAAPVDSQNFAKQILTGQP